MATLHEGIDATAATVPVADLPTLLRWAAGDYLRRGWRPFPVRLTFDKDGKKVPHFPKGFSWTELRERAFSVDETQELFSRPIVPSAGWEPSNGEEWVPEANAVGIVLEAGHIVVDTDSREAAEVVAGCVLPEGPRVRTRRGGLHLHFRASEELTEKTERPGGGLEFLCAQAVFMPPSLGRYGWERLPDGDLPELPASLAMMVRLARGGGKLSSTKREAKKREPAKRETRATADAVPADGSELAAWEAVIGPTGPDGPTRRKALCPLHHETKPSFTLQRMRTTGRLRGKCFGCEFSGSLRQLKVELRRGDTTLYRRGFDAVASFGDEIDEQTRRALRELVAVAQERQLDPRDAVRLSHREMATRTGCEPVDYPEGGPTNREGQVEGVMRWRGSGVLRLQEKMRRAGVEIRRGLRRVAGRDGRPTQYLLPSAWFADGRPPQAPGESSGSRREERPEVQRLPSPDAAVLQANQGEGQTDCDGVAALVLAEFPGAEIEQEPTETASEGL